MMDRDSKPEEEKEVEKGGGNSSGNSYQSNIKWIEGSPNKSDFFRTNTIDMTNLYKHLSKLWMKLEAHKPIEE